jgi:deoxyribodipyrimidine photolyase
MLGACFGAGTANAMVAACLKGQCVPLMGGMRCLTNYFRRRAMVVSFAFYHRWLHWRETALPLAREFLDYEPGIHYSQVQMQSGVTGINTVRIYNPVKQARDQDPDSLFDRRWIPALANVPNEVTIAVAGQPRPTR